MGIKEQLSEDLKTAMRAKDSLRLNTIRSVRAAITQKEVDGGKELDDAAVFDLIRGLRKQRIESIEQYKAGGRDDLVDTEVHEKELLEAYLPAAPSRDTIEAAVQGVIKELGASSIKDMGRVVAAAKGKLAGVDGKELSDVVKGMLVR
jgi:uncharacterized protein